MVPPLEPLTFENLTEVYRREQRSKNITEVRKDLYPAMRECMDQLKRENEKEFVVDRFSTKAKLISNQLVRFQEKTAQVFEFRIEKMLRMALRAAEGNRVDTANLTVEELEIFEKVSGLLKVRRSMMMEGNSASSMNIAASAVEDTVQSSALALGISMSSSIRAVPETSSVMPQGNALIGSAMDKQVNVIPSNGQPDLQVPIDGPRMPNDMTGSLGAAPTNSIGPVPKVAPQVNAISVPSSRIASGQTAMDQMLIRILEDLPAIAGLIATIA